MNKRKDQDIGDEAFEKAHETIGALINAQPKEIVALALIVDQSGEYAAFANNFNVSRADIYQTLGLLEQMKIDLLASIPRNRPLREPADNSGDEDDDEIDEPIGQA